MPTQQPDEVSLEQWAYLTQLLSNETNVGSTGPGSGTNTTGRLQKIWTVEQSIHITSGMYPSIGVQLVSSREEEYSTHGHMLFTTFHIAIAAVDLGSPAGMNPTPASLTVAMANLRPNLSDGIGNGVGAILRDSVNYLLGGLAIKTGIRSTTWDWKFDAGPGSAAFAYAVVEYYAQQKVGIG